MTEHLTGPERAVLRLSGSPGASERILQRSFQVGHGRVPTSARAVSPRYRPATSTCLEEVGLSLEIAEEPEDRVRVSSDDGSPLEAHALSASAVREEPDHGFIVADLAAAGVLAVHSVHGVQIVMCLESGEIRIDRYELDVSELPQFDVDRSEVRRWYSGTSDAWLAHEMDARLANNDAWSAATAVALFARLRTPDSDLSSVFSDSETTAPHRWVQGLGGTSIEALEGLALAEVDRLHALLSNLREEFAPEDDDWRRDLIEILRARDDLDGVMMMLRWLEQGADLEAHLRGLDRAGARLMSASPMEFRAGDEQLQRAALALPNSWWTGPGLPE